MSRYYYGLWQNIYRMSWPLRFLFELLISIAVITVVWKLIRKLGRLFGVRNRLIKLWVWLISEISYLIGRNRDWVVKLDNRMKEWGAAAIQHRKSKKHGGLRKGMVIAVIILYAAAVFVDLPVTQRLQGYYLTGLSGVKSFFQKWEGALSKGYEEYPPLFVWKEKEDSGEKSEEETKNGEPIYLQLNERGRGGANIRREPSMEGAVVGGVSGDMEVLYQNEWTSDGERYWIRVYLPEENVEGWLSGNLIEGEQLEMILNTP